MVYRIGMALVGVPVFLGCWIYCVATYGFIVGVLVGWMPSAIVAVIAGAMWPLFALVIGWALLHGSH
jgi:hypothetical protein